MPEQLVVSLLNRVPAPLTRPFRSSGALARAAAPLLERALPREPTDVIVRAGRGAGLVLAIDAQREKYYWTGLHEERVQNVLLAILRPGAAFWDVGAHIGFFTGIAARRVGPTGTVHAFEPSTANRKRLLGNVARNGFANVVVHAAAVADAAGERVLHAHASSPMWSLEGTGDDGELVRCTTLDDHLAAYGAPDVIKIDAEGVELDVLRGGARLFADHCPVVIVELTSDRDVQRAAELVGARAAEAIDDTHVLLRRERAA